MSVKKVKKQKITGKALRYILSIAWKEQPLFFLVYFFQLIAETGRTLMMVIMPKYIVDDLVSFIGGTPFEDVKPLLIRDILFVVVLYFVGGIIIRLTGAIRVSYGEWFNRYLEEELTQHARTMDFEYTEDPAVLDKLNKAKEGISWYSGGVEGIITNFYTVIMNVSVLAGIITIIITGCPWLLPLQLLSLMLVVYFNYRNNQIEIKSFTELAALNRKFGYFFYRIADFRFGKDIRLYDSIDMMSEKADKENHKMLNVWSSRMKKTRHNSWGMDIVNSLRDGSSYFYLGYLAVTKVITIGDFTMYTGAASNFFWSLYHIVEGIQEVIKRCSYINEYIEFMQYPATLKEGNEVMADGDHTIEVRDVSFKYPRSEDYSLREYRKILTVVFQDFQLFAFTLRENVVLDAENPKDADVERALSLSGVYEDAVKLENGLDTIIYKSFDEKGTELSGGQKQKVAISRALYRNAPIVILDEPTAALDPVAEYDIYRKFNELVGGKTALYISHRLSSCKFCDHIAVFSDCHIKEYGTHEELMKIDNGIYAGMFKAQAQYYV